MPSATTAVLNDCYSKITAYTMLAYSYWAIFYDALDAYVMPQGLPRGQTHTSTRAYRHSWTEEARRVACVRLV